MTTQDSRAGVLSKREKEVSWVFMVMCLITGFATAQDVLEDPSQSYRAMPAPVALGIFVVAFVYFAARLARHYLAGRRRG